MSNVDIPFGFRALRNEAGTAPKITEYTSVNSTTIYEASTCMINTTGQVSMWDGTGTTYQRLLGVAVHGKTKADTDRKILLYDDPMQEYEAQTDDASVTVLGALIGRNFAAVNPTSGNGTTMQSIAEIDGSSGTTIINTTSLAIFKGLRFSRNAEMDQTTTWTKVVVKINPKCHIWSGEDLGV